MTLDKENRFKFPTCADDHGAKCPRFSQILDLEKQLVIANNQMHNYTRELSHAYLRNKSKREQLIQVNKQLVKYAEDLHKTLYNLKKTHDDLQESYHDTIHRLVLASEYKDSDTGNHIARISRYSSFIATQLGFPQYETECLSYAAPMHDVGKIGIPDHIILKNGKLSEQEFSIIKTHTTIGAGILKNSQAKVLQLAQSIALSHHERWDGLGYPHGLQKDEIPTEARIIALLDTFDALTSKRPYKNPYPIDISCSIIKKERGKKFDPEIVDLFLNNINSIVNIKKDIDKVDYENSSLTFDWSERDTCEGILSNS